MLYKTQSNKLKIWNALVIKKQILNISVALWNLTLKYMRAHFCLKNNKPCQSFIVYEMDGFIFKNASILKQEVIVNFKTYGIHCFYSYSGFTPVVESRILFSTFVSPCINAFVSFLFKEGFLSKELKEFWIQV